MPHTTNISDFFHTILLFLFIFSTTPEKLRAQTLCEYETRGTTIPNTSGTPLVINTTSGTVISANFFGSGAIDAPYFDGYEYVSVCINHRDRHGNRTASITTDVGLDNDTQIKGYPQFVVGTKFGNIYETSFRYYPNTGLPQSHQWPVTVTNLSDNNSYYQLANLEYISKEKGVGLPAFTNDLPEIHITIDIDEENVVGSERDVMIESWFYDTSANADLLGNNIATGLPATNTLNNIVGIGHPHYSALDNTLLEMMVHIGALSPNDASQAKRNPGQNQLTETYSGKDTDNDGIDDHFDVDSHVNQNNNLDPNPGVYSSGIDQNQDGIDDADILPVTIGDYQYSIWFGESFLAPIVIFSRETNSSLLNDFDPSKPDMDLSTEGELNLHWNKFLDFTLNDLQHLLVGKAEWANGTDSPFIRMTAPGGAIGGVELGVEPQINNTSDLPYTAIINRFDVTVDGKSVGLNSSRHCEGFEDLSLSPGVRDGTQHGWKWGNNTNKNVLIACFASSGRELNLDVTGYDIDFNGEVEIFLNGTPIGWIPAGINNRLTTPETFTIPLSLQYSGTNEIRFSQRTSGFKWGVTDLMIYPTPKKCDGSQDVDLTLETTITTDFGWKWGTNDNKDNVIACFNSKSSNVTLEVTGYDIDYVNEATVTVNERFIGTLPIGLNNKHSPPQTFNIPSDWLRNTGNVITFHQNNQGNKWGITNLLLSDESDHIPLTIGTPDGNHYGHNHASNQHKNSASFAFQSNSDQLRLKATAYDIDFDGEVTVTVNNTIVGKMAPGHNNQHTSEQIFEIHSAVLEPHTTNILTFEQSYSGNTWGVSDIVLTTENND